MKMNPVLKKAILLGSMGTSLVATSAQAQFAPPKGNLSFGMVEATPGAFDIVVDLGNFTRFTSGSSAILLGGSSASEAYQGIGPATISENRFSTSDVLATFGDLNSVLFSAFGVSTDVANNSRPFLTKARSNPDVQSTPFATASATSLGTTGNELEAVRNNAVNTGTDFNNTSTKEALPSTLSYSTKVPPAGYTGMEGNTGAAFGANDIRRLDLYAMAGSVAADYLGYFEFQGDGDLWFIPENFVPIPEASTYGLVAGAGLLFMALRRQLGARFI